MTVQSKNNTRLIVLSHLLLGATMVIGLGFTFTGNTCNIESTIKEALSAYLQSLSVFSFSLGPLIGSLILLDVFLYPWCVPRHNMHGMVVDLINPDFQI